MNNPKDSQQTIRKHSVRIDAHRTSVSIEDIFWQELVRIAKARNVSVNALISKIDHTRSGNLSSAIRVFVLNDAKKSQSR